MKTRRSFWLLALCATASLSASPLTQTSAVQLQPEANAGVITVLQAGTEPTPATGVSAPDGWIAVQLPGPFEGYVPNKELTKQLDVKVGTPIRIAPGPEAGVLETFQKGDKIQITGLHGGWTQLTLDKALVGYIRISQVSTPAPQPVQATTPPSTAVYPVPSGQEAPLPRMFEGTFASTRRPFMPRRPYDWQLVDAAGKRFAYIDIHRLLLTDQIDNYTGHAVTVFGTAKASGTDLVIEAESLRLK